MNCCPALASVFTLCKGKNQSQSLTFVHTVLYTNPDWITSSVRFRSLLAVTIPQTASSLPPMCGRRKESQATFVSLASNLLRLRVRGLRGERSGVREGGRVVHQRGYTYNNLHYYFSTCSSRRVYLARSLTHTKLFVGYNTENIKIYDREGLACRSHQNVDSYSRYDPVMRKSGGCPILKKSCLRSTYSKPHMDSKT